LSPGETLMKKAKWIGARAGLLDASIKVGIKAPGTMSSLFTQIDDRWALLDSVGRQQWSKFGQVLVGVDDASQIISRG
jgi:long-subunit fatty acid transport protein